MKGRGQEIRRQCGCSCPSSLLPIVSPPPSLLPPPPPPPPPLPCHTLPIISLLDCIASLCTLGAGFRVAIAVTVTIAVAVALAVAVAVVVAIAIAIAVAVAITIVITVPIAIAQPLPTSPQSPLLPPSLQSLPMSPMLLLLSSAFHIVTYQHQCDGCEHHDCAIMVLLTPLCFHFHHSQVGCLVDPDQPLPTPPMFQHSQHATADSRMCLHCLPPAKCPHHSPIDMLPPKPQPMTCTLEGTANAPPTCTTAATPTMMHPHSPTEAPLPSSCKCPATNALRVGKHLRASSGRLLLHLIVVSASSSLLPPLCCCLAVGHHH